MFKRNTKGTEAFLLLSFALLTIYYVGMALFDGPVWCVDSPSYVSMDFSREPVYPLFLLGVKTLWEALNLPYELYGLPGYLTLAVIIQSILWAFAAVYLGNFVLDVARRDLSSRRSCFLAAFAMVSQVAVSFLNRFIANRGSMYSECIMTESLAMPLYVIFTVLLIKSFDKYDTRTVLKLFFLGVIISSIRKQMLIMVLTWGFASFVLHIIVKNHRSLKNFSITVIAVILCLFFIAVLDRGYNLAVRGVFAGHIGNSKGGLDTVLYTATPEDSALFAKVDDTEFPDMEALYTRIYQECVSRQLTIDFAPGYELKEKSTVFNSDWSAMASHYADSYDVIGFEVVLPICDEYVAEHFPELDQVHAQIKENQVEDILLSTLLKNTITNIATGNDRGAKYVLTANILKAFVISNANMTPAVLIKISILLYIVYLVTFIALLLRKQSWSGNVIKRMMFIVLATIAINCVVTGSMIFPQPRYMCYGMGVFYLAIVCGILI